MILGIVAIPATIIWLGIIPAILAVIFGFVGRSRAKRGDADNGGQALAGIICGFVAVVLFIAYVALVVALVHHAHTTCYDDGDCYTD